MNQFTRHQFNNEKIIEKTKALKILISKGTRRQNDEVQLEISGER